jgi:glutathione S-transferase
LLIGNKNYSSWSMRPWLLLHHLGVQFTEERLSFADPQWKVRVAELSPSARVPVLWIDDDPVWESLAIAEAIAETFPPRRCGPSMRAHAGSHARSAARCTPGSPSCAGTCR